MAPTPRCSKTSSPPATAVFPSRREGSALLLTLMVVSLLMVLVLSFVILVRMGLRETALQHERVEARQNARLGLELALSQLQKHAGADQRATVPATAVYPEKDFNELYDGDADTGPAGGMVALYRNRARTSNRRSYLDRVETYLTPAERNEWEADLRSWWAGLNPHWVGVVDGGLRVDRASDPATPALLPDERYESNPDTVFGEPDRAQLPVWLIGGNERFDLDPRASAYPAGYLTPDQPLGDPDSDPGLVWLVGEGSAAPAAESVDGLDGRVAAPLLEVRDPDGSVRGRYAYWVADESMKANFAVREPAAYAGASEGSVEYRNRLQVPQRIGWERMEGFAEVFDANPSMDVNDPAFEKLATRQQIPLLHPDFDGPVHAGFHHVTSHSVSLLTDSALGGLKRDLTRYLRDGEGLDDDDPIADPDLYGTDDSRFAAHGGFNSGFPHDSDAALHGIPTWGELREWYQNTADPGVGALQPDPQSGLAPVLTYLHFQMGLSYHGPSQKVRIHWAPMLTLWNPYDVPLREATYDLDLGIAPAFDHVTVVDPDPSLSDLQTVDPEADWRDWSVPVAGPVSGPNGKPVLEAYMDGGDMKARTFSASGPGTVRIFKADLEEADLDIPGGDETNRYFVRIEPPPANEPGSGEPIDALNLPDTYNISQGPFTADSDPHNGTSDAFGRLYYATGAAHPDMFHEFGRFNYYKTKRPGALGRKDYYTTVSPHDAVEGRTPEVLPVDRPFRLSLRSGFAPGEVRVFTLDDSREWTSARHPMVNDYDPDFPGFLWLDFLDVRRGPSSAESAGLRFFMKIHQSSRHHSLAAATVRITQGGEVVFETEQFGDLDVNKVWDMGMGRDWMYRLEYKDRDGDGEQERKEDWDGDGVINGDEEYPAFVADWRRLYDTGNFEDRLLTQTGSETRASNWSFGESFMTPFSGHWTLGHHASNSIHLFAPAFSRFNLGAADFQEHPLVERTRGAWTTSNLDADGNISGLMKLLLQKGRSNEAMGNANEIRWDGGQVDQSVGTRGYALTEFRNDGSQPIVPLSQVAIRQPRRADSEILSLGQFQQVNLSPYFWQPSFPIGSGDAAPYVDREAIAGIHSRIVGAGKFNDHMPPGTRPNHARPTSGNVPFPTSVVPASTQARAGRLDFYADDGRILDSTPLGGNTMLDLGYLLNENLWDRYVLSTVAGASAGLQDPLPNARLRYAAGAPAPGALRFDTAAAHLRNHGALNVNSTSVEAWKALLTAFRDLKLGDNPDDTVPVSRTLDPIEGSVAFHFDTDELGPREQDEYGAVSTGKDYGKVLSGFRYLDDDMIQALAERIVDEVRLRGPFYTLADFVNRRLAPPDGSNREGSAWHEARTNGIFEPGSTQNETDYMDPTYDPFPGLHGLNGALQRALNLSGINGGVNHPSMGADGEGTGDRYDMVYTLRIRDTGGARYDGDRYTANGIGGSANAAFGSNNGSFGYRHTQDPAIRSHVDTEHMAGAPVGEAGQLLQGAPGFVTQGDLLAMIGPALTARGDTFLIRAYGESGDGPSPFGRAWLEAVVQRTPEPVHPHPDDPWRPTSRFGRRFHVLSIRWLTPEEI